jgi:hypothetical protein
LEIRNKGMHSLPKMDVHILHKLKCGSMFICDGCWFGKIVLGTIIFFSVNYFLANYSSLWWPPLSAAHQNSRGILLGCLREPRSYHTPWR